ncbi:hypothetical protein ABKA04_003286 [Annulohypoxylon sp. FPYF3050]
MWLPIILSLDGGGVKGLSSLYFLREIMVSIRELERSSEDSGAAGSADSENLPLPCNYFDFMVGTSTGGLIATMLGRLRMGVDDCIKQYLIISNKVFGPFRIPFLQNYSGDDLSESYDYMESGMPSWIGDEERVNKTCKVAVTSIRNGGANSHSSKGVDILYLFRSYDSATRYIDGEINPRVLDRSKLHMNESSRATTAAPTYFPPLKMRGRLFMDGGILANNPSQIALNEATRMCNEPHYNKSKKPIRHPLVLVSIGTGGSEGHESFSFGGLLRSLKNKLTDPEPTHRDVRGTCANSGTHYFRFNVQEDKARSVKGLQMGLDDCKKKNSKLPWVEKIKKSDITDLELNAQEKNQRGGYKPDKYHYTTFNEIRDQTRAYFNEPYDQSEKKVKDMLEECAKLLFRYRSTLILTILVDELGKALGFFDWVKFLA